jgi:putative transposase
VARRERMYLGGYTYHVVQRGNNRQPCFTEPLDYVLYSDYLQDALLRYGVVLHAFALMGNHVHLLMTPGCEDGISRVMSLVGNRYVQYVNKHYGRTGTLWEGRHRACVIDTERYLLNCYRYIDLNPVRAGLVSHPYSYYWCSYACNAHGVVSEIVTPHPEYLALGVSVEKRCAAYHGLCELALRQDELQEIRQATRSGLPLGYVVGVPMPQQHVRETRQLYH